MKTPPKIFWAKSFELFVIVLAIGGFLWATLVIYFSSLPEQFRIITAIVYPIISILSLSIIKPRWLAWSFSLVLFLFVFVAWFSMKPSNERDWQPDVARLAWAEIDNDRIRVHNIRNCDYTSEFKYVPSYYDREFLLSDLESIDLYTVDWGLKYMVHTMVSFAFKNAQYLCISIETRKEVGEEYSTVKGFFRQYELYYVVADERDVVRLRTNYRQNEITRLYRIKNLSGELMRSIFLDYIGKINALKRTPQWYNALTTNCTTSIRHHVQPYTGHSSLDWRIVINGYLDELLYEDGALFSAQGLETLRQHSIINERAIRANSSPDFSKLIRAGLPGFPASTPLASID